MHILINDTIRSLNAPESYEYTPDDRQQIIKIMQSNVVQDYGHIQNGDTLSLQGLQFALKDFEKIYEFWEQRTKVKLTDHNGTEWQNVRIKIEKYSYVEKFKDYITTDLTFWMI